MNTIIKQTYKKDKEKEENTTPEKNIRRKRQELSVSATKTVNKHDVKIIVKFE